MIFHNSIIVVNLVYLCKFNLNCENFDYLIKAPQKNPRIPVIICNIPLLIPIGLCGLNISIRVTPKWYCAPECLHENNIAIHKDR